MDDDGKGFFLLDQLSPDQRHLLYGWVEEVTWTAVLNLRAEWLRRVKEISDQGREDAIKNLTEEILSIRARMDRMSKDQLSAGESRRNMLLEVFRLRKEHKELEAAAQAGGSGLGPLLEHGASRASQLEKEAVRLEDEFKRPVPVLIKLRCQANLLEHFALKLRRGEDLALPKWLKTLSGFTGTDAPGYARTFVEVHDRRVAMIGSMNDLFRACSDEKIDWKAWRNRHRTVRRSLRVSYTEGDVHDFIRACRMALPPSDNLRTIS